MEALKDIGSALDLGLKEDESNVIIVIQQLSQKINEFDREKSEWERQRIELLDKLRRQQSIIANLQAKIDLAEQNLEKESSSYQHPKRELDLDISSPTLRHRLDLGIAQNGTSTIRLPSISSDRMSHAQSPKRTNQVDQQSSMDAPPPPPPPPLPSASSSSSSNQAMDEPVSEIHPSNTFADMNAGNGQFHTLIRIKKRPVVGDDSPPRDMSNDIDEPPQNRTSLVSRGSLVNGLNSAIRSSQGRSSGVNNAGASRSGNKPSTVPLFSSMLFDNSMNDPSPFNQVGMTGTLPARFDINKYRNSSSMLRGKPGIVFPPSAPTSRLSEPSASLAPSTATALGDTKIDGADDSRGRISDPVTRNVVDSSVSFSPRGSPSRHGEGETQTGRSPSPATSSQMRNTGKQSSQAKNTGNFKNLSVSPHRQINGFEINPLSDAELTNLFVNEDDFSDAVESGSESSDPKMNSSSISPNGSGRFSSGSNPQYLTGGGAGGAGRRSDIAIRSQRRAKELDHKNVYGTTSLGWVKAMKSSASARSYCHLPLSSNVLNSTSSSSMTVDGSSAPLSSLHVDGMGMTDYSYNNTNFPLTDVLTVNSQIPHLEKSATHAFHLSPIQYVGCDPTNNNNVFSVDQNHTICQWKYDYKECSSVTSPFYVYRGPPDRITTACWIPAHKCIATAGREGFVYITRLNTFSDETLSVANSEGPNSRNDSKGFMINNHNYHNDLLTMFSEHNDTVWSLFVNNHDYRGSLREDKCQDLLFSGGADGLVVYDLQKNSSERLPLEKGGKRPTKNSLRVTSLTSNVNHQHVIFSGLTNGSVVMTDLNLQTVIRSYSVPQPEENDIDCLDIHPSLPLVVAGTKDGKIVMLDVRDPKYVVSIPAHMDSVTDIVFHPWLNCIITAGGDGNISVWCARERRLLQSMYSVHKPYFNESFITMDIESCSGTLVTGGSDGYLHIFG